MRLRFLAAQMRRPDQFTVSFSLYTFMHLLCPFSQHRILGEGKNKYICIKYSTVYTRSLKLSHVSTYVGFRWILTNGK